MQNAITLPQEKTEAVQLTAQDRNVIVFALGTLMGTTALDDNRKLTPLAKEALRVAGKFGVTYEL